MNNSDKTVLLVEDQPMLAMMTKMWLNDLGLHVVVSDDGLMAKRLLETQQFTFIVTDLVMPKLDGAGLLEWMKQENIVTPTIVVTGINDDNELNKIRAIPFVKAVLEKPLTPEQLNDAQALLNA